MAAECGAAALGGKEDDEGTNKSQMTKVLSFGIDTERCLYIEEGQVVCRGIEEVQGSTLEGSSLIIL